MSLITEDGTGKFNAESYCSVAQATSFHSVRSTVDSWGDMDVDKQEACLRAATDYITQTFGGRWGGDRKSSTQALEWPRVAVPWPDGYLTYRPDGTIPQELVNACAELALKAYSGPLLADLGRETSSESVDVISVSYVPGSSRQTKYPTVERWLRSLLVGASVNSISVSRA